MEKIKLLRSTGLYGVVPLVGQHVVTAEPESESKGVEFFEVMSRSRLS